MITPELKQNIWYTLYFTITHNVPVFFFGTCIIGSIILSLYKPTRKSILLLLGFISLLLGYEYEKHIVEGIKEQTMNSLITINEHYTLRRIINVFFIKILPFSLYAGGLLLVLGSITGFLIQLLHIDRFKKIT